MSTCRSRLPELQDPAGRGELERLHRPRRRGGHGRAPGRDGDLELLRRLGVLQRDERTYTATSTTRASPITVSSGDAGYGVEFPAASQYVTAVGGTSLTLVAATRAASESAWSGAGSGCSAYVGQAFLAARQRLRAAHRRRRLGRRGPEHRRRGLRLLQVPRPAGWIVFGGTSASAPIIASVYALAGTPRAACDSALYPSATAPSSTTSRPATTAPAPRLFCTAVRYDGPTGLGTPPPRSIARRYCCASAGLPPRRGPLGRSPGLRARRDPGRGRGSRSPRRRPARGSSARRRPLAEPPQRLDLEDVGDRGAEHADRGADGETVGGQELAAALGDPERRHQDRRDHRRHRRPADARARARRPGRSARCRRPRRRRRSAPGRRRGRRLPRRRRRRRGGRSRPRRAAPRPGPAAGASR